MKKLISILTVILVAVVLFSACKKPDGRDDFVGTYRAVEKVPGWDDDVYNITISKSSTNESDVIITGLLGVPALSCYAPISGNSITIPLQTFSDATFSGSGRLNGLYLNLSIQVTITGYAPYNATIDCTKL
jgi:hypothetical protein